MPTLGHAAHTLPCIAGSPTSVPLVDPPSSLCQTAANGTRGCDEEGLGGDLPDSTAYRDGVRSDLMRLAAEGGLKVPMARTYPLERALDAVALLRGRHPGGKVALLPAHPGTHSSAATGP